MLEILLKKKRLNNVRNIIKKEKNTSRCTIQRIIEIIINVWQQMHN